MTTIQQDNLCNITGFMLMTDDSVFKMHKTFLAGTTVKNTILLSWKKAMNARLYYMR